jgi:hypothetical protein
LCDLWIEQPEKEIDMENNVFEDPVSIIVGLSFPTRVETVAEAYGILSEWPHYQRDNVHAFALKACKAALAGEIDAETARVPFIAFAKKNALLLPRNEPVVAARATETQGQRLPT